MVGWVGESFPSLHLSIPPGPSLRCQIALIEQQTAELASIWSSHFTSKRSKMSSRIMLQPKFCASSSIWKCMFECVLAKWWESIDREVLRLQESKSIMIWISLQVKVNGKNIGMSCWVTQWGLCDIGCLELSEFPLKMLARNQGTGRHHRNMVHNVTYTLTHQSVNLFIAQQQWMEHQPFHLFFVFLVLHPAHDGRTRRVNLKF